ncbi:MAG: slipin family protein [Candidatus Saccharibacteria bacterium]|nr:slipin family protein [Candidatus Saccharibacteria bacterium]
MADLFVSLFWLIILAVAVLPAAIRITNEYERGVIFRLGRFAGVKGPGLFFIIPIIDRMVKVDLRVVTMDVPPQEVISEDNVPIKVDAVVYFKVSDPQKATIDIENFRMATSQVSQTTLRTVTGSSSLDEILTNREKVNQRLHSIIDQATDPWGIKVTSVEVKHVEIPSNMQRAIAKQAEAERMRRAKIILAEGEYQASDKLRQAGEVLNASPIALRYLETLTDAAKEPNTTILFPMEMISFVNDLLEKPKKK